MNKKGLTLVEILVSSLILALIMIGLANLFVAGKRHILHSRSRMAGGELEKFFLEPLQMNVRQDQWGGNCLSTNGVNPPGCNTAAWIDPSSGIQYTPQYQIGGLLVDFLNPLGRLRRVILTLNWNEPAP